MGSLSLFSLDSILKNFPMVPAWHNKFGFVIDLYKGGLLRCSVDNEYNSNPLFALHGNFKKKIKYINYNKETCL